MFWRGRCSIYSRVTGTVIVETRLTNNKAYET